MVILVVITGSGIVASLLEGRGLGGSSSSRVAASLTLDVRQRDDRDDWDDWDYRFLRGPAAAACAWLACSPV